MDAALGSLTSNLSKPIIPDNIVLQVFDVCVKPIEDAQELLPGILSLIERPVGIFIEWIPIEDGNESSGWVLAGGSDENIANHSISNESTSSRDIINKLKFSIDVNDLSSYRLFEPKKKGLGYPSIRFICSDGSSPMALYFRTISHLSFIETLERYVSLRRSSHDSNLFIVVDEKAEALAKSVTMLDGNDDILSRFINNPYATALTGLGKITSFMQDQVIPALLESDEISQEEQIRTMRELRNREEEGSDLRVHTDTEFEVVTQLELPPRPEIYRVEAVTKDFFTSFKSSDGSIEIQKVHHLKMNIFRGGLHPDIRKVAWKYLLGYRTWDESDAAFEQKRIKMQKDYERMRSQWLTINDDQESRFGSFSKRKGLIEKDVARTDRTLEFYQGPGNKNLVKLQSLLMTYVMYDFDLGYVQGMSDFASQILYIMDDEIDAFWCFVNLMKRIHRNFEIEQTYTKQQMNELRDLVMLVNPRLANYLESNQSDDMYFCFRWVIVWFKREFSFHDTTKLWEVILTDQPCPNFLLLVCVAILDKETDTIIDNKFGLTEILKHVNDLTMHLDLDEVLTAAEAIFFQLSLSQDKLPNHICRYLKLGDMTLYAD